MATCKFCGKDKKLVKAHIIPRSLYGFPKEKGYEPYKFITNVKGFYSSRSATGVYDPELVCLDCESMFSAPDKYAYEIFLGSKSVWKKRPNIKAKKIPPEDFDYKLFKLFFLTLLWRSSTTKQPFFRKVELGPHIDQIRQMILDKNPGTPDDFSVVLAVFNSETASGAMLDPDRSRFDGVNYIRFYLAGYVAYVKIDQRKAPTNLRELQASPDIGLIAIERSFERSKEFTALTKLVKKTSFNS
ncbi:hypothetical protein ACFOY8_01490 [Thalassospira xianhensis]|uniref:HNH endonuclease 5 domain-containing protein n=1 Tax=Thalassospira xianhensis MCCC 1A02616 TaxID=1177929 RepID=A0A367UAT9_9PROT|nr:hypothetical protein [Thalassospira xianhensis]RCK04833.1 hypothetical protein TH5_17315 [Thalassospira xianhensis MCCC 1A02616]